MPKFDDNNETGIYTLLNALTSPKDCTMYIFHIIEILLALINNI
jgi:hypothetical protein